MELTDKQNELFMHLYGSGLEALVETLNKMILARDIDGVNWLIANFSFAVTVAARTIKSNDLAN